MQYPASVLDDPENLLSFLGTFWQQLYQDRLLVWSFCRGKAEMERQTYQDALETGAALGYETCPILHTALWHPLTLRADTKLPGKPFVYGGGEVYGPQPGGGAVFLYGDGLDSSVAWSFEEAGAENLKSCRVVTSGIAAQSVILTEGVDFLIDLDQSLVVFRDDPFNDPRIQQETADDGVAVITMWAFRGGFERNLVRDQYGYALGLEAESSLNYRELVAAILDSMASGPSIENFQRAFAAIADAPVAKGVETVEDVVVDANYLWVLTDQNAYRFKSTSTALVEIGDVVRAGQPLVDTVRIDQPNGAIPAGLTSLTVPADFFAGVTTGALTFEDTNASLVVTTGVSGKTKVAWALGGAAGDVTAFFNKLHAKGVTAGATLANFLDQRPVEAQTAEPTADNLPTTVNPLQMLFENVFRGNLLLVRTRSDQFGPDALGSSFQWVLRKILPPSLALLVVDD